MERVAERTAATVADVQAEHAQNYRTFRDLVMLKLNVMTHQCTPDQPFEHLEANLGKINAMTLNFLSLVLDRCVKGERIALGLDYENFNTAIKTLTTAGFEVVVPEGMEDLSHAVKQLTDGSEAIEMGREEVEV